MSSSELSNALNPYICQYRPTRSYPQQYQPQYDQVVQPQPLQVLPPQPLPPMPVSVPVPVTIPVSAPAPAPAPAPGPGPAQHYAPTRSELEFAFVEPPRPPPPPPQPPPLHPLQHVAHPRQPTATSSSVQAVHQLLRVVTETRSAQEIERQRRATWEQEQEKKYLQKQADMENLIKEMRHEISSLRSSTGGQARNASGLLPPQYPPNVQPNSPISPTSQYPGDYYPTFVQGSSSQPLPGNYTFQDDFQVDNQTAAAAILTPAPSPPYTASSRHEHSPAPSSQKRGRPQFSSDDDGFNSDTSSARPVKRVNGHDKRILTIHAALRNHISHAMELEDGDELPDSHVEGQSLTSQDPIRFVWEKTTRQSVHNGRMKARILTDMKFNRTRYKHVPDKEFGKKALEAAFEAVYTTLRQKFKAQRDASQAHHLKQREDTKAQKARHLSRRKIKLTNRSEARMKLDAFSHVTFDGALQLECVSSEESDQDDSSSGILRTRGYSWRSSRLLRFYAILDAEDKATGRPKRGVGRKERFAGPVKDGFHLPPSGVATWMISQRWIRDWQTQYQDLPDVLAKRINDVPGFDWDHLHQLGEESDADDEGDQDQDQVPHLDHAVYPTIQHGVPLDYGYSPSINSHRN